MPRMSAADKLSEYRLTVDALKDDIVKLFRILDLAEVKQRRVTWNGYYRLLDMLSAQQLPLDFYLEVFDSGVRIEQVFPPPVQARPFETRIYRMLHSRAERRLAFISTLSHEYRVAIPESQLRWALKYGGADDALIPGKPQNPKTRPV